MRPIVVSLALLSVAAAQPVFTAFSYCPSSASVCYEISQANFTAGCTSMGGQVGTGSVWDTMGVAQLRSTSQLHSRLAAHRFAGYGATHLARFSALTGLWSVSRLRAVRCWTTSASCWAT